LTDNTRPGSASTGRVNIHATVDGLCDFVEREIHALNAIHESITVATLPASVRVVAGQIIATVKIIPYAASTHHVQLACETIGSGLQVHAAVRLTACLIQTELSSLTSQALDKTRIVTEHRLMKRQSTLLNEQRTAHSTPDIVISLQHALTLQPDMVLIFGASAISDRRDSIPAAITQLGGTIEHFGMPMDPGNLLLIASIGAVKIIGMPGCAWTD